MDTDWYKITLQPYDYVIRYVRECYDIPLVTIKALNTIRRHPTYRYHKQIRTVDGSPVVERYKAEWKWLHVAHLQFVLKSFSRLDVPHVPHYECRLSNEHVLRVDDYNNIWIRSEVIGWWFFIRTLELRYMTKGSNLDRIYDFVRPTDVMHGKLTLTASFVRDFLQQRRIDRKTAILRRIFERIAKKNHFERSLEQCIERWRHSLWEPEGPLCKAGYEQCCRIIQPS